MKTDLSARELAVLNFAAKGYTDDMVASELGIQTGTVNSYWVRIRGKLGNLSRSELVAQFVQKNADSLHKDSITKLGEEAVRLADENRQILALADEAYKTLTARTQATADALADQNRHDIEAAGAAHEAYVLRSDSAAASLAIENQQILAHADAIHNAYVVKSDGDAASLADENSHILELANAEIERLKALLVKASQ